METDAIEELAGEAGENSCRSTRLHGYGVRRDSEARCYRVRNESTGERLCQPSGERAGFGSFDAAWSAWRCFEVHKRSGEHGRDDPARRRRPPQHRSGLLGARFVPVRELPSTMASSRCARVDEAHANRTLPALVHGRRAA